MKLWHSILLTVLAAGASAQAQQQVKIELVTDQDQYLSEEDIKIGVRITNLAGVPLRFGEDAEWLNFSVENVDRSTVKKRAEVPVKGPFVSESGTRTTARFDLVPFYDLSKSGAYNIIASVRINELGQVYRSLPLRIKILKGFNLWEQEVGVPPTAVSNGPLESRKYVLQQTQLISGQNVLYLRVTDSTGTRTYKVQPVGTLLQFNNPEQQLDQRNNLHIMHQNGAKTFNYAVYSPDGALLQRQSYEYSNRPHLARSEDGAVVVKGGIKRVSPNDYPQPEASNNSSTESRPSSR